MTFLGGEKISQTHISAIHTSRKLAYVISVYACMTKKSAASAA